MNEQKSGSGNVWAIIIAIILIIAVIGSCSSGGGSSSSSSKTAKCQSCGRSFKAGDAGGNYKSIARTNMCKNCYNNYKWAQSALDGLAPDFVDRTESHHCHLDLNDCYDVMLEEYHVCE